MSDHLRGKFDISVTTAHMCGLVIIETPWGMPDTRHIISLGFNKRGTVSEVFVYAQSKFNQWYHMTNHYRTSLIYK